MIYIIAGHKNQFNHYIATRNIKPQDAVCVTSLEQLRGLRDQTLIRYGTWWERGLRCIEQITMRGWMIKDESD